MEAFKKILFPVSLTPISPKVAPYVASMAEKYEAEIHLLHVTRALGAMINTYIVQPSVTEFKKLASNVEQEIVSGAQSRLSDFQKKYFDNFPNLKTTVVSGNNYKEILNYVEAEKIDIIIMGTGSPLHKMVFGAVADKVSKLATVPVMLIKTV
jgi:nucleotide-binding universal stress UspA family protein